MAEVLVQPRIADLHQDWSATAHQTNGEPHAPNLARRRPDQRLGEVLPIGAYGGPDSKYANKVLAVDAPAVAESKAGLLVTNIYPDPKGDIAELFPWHRQFYGELFTQRPDVLIPVASTPQLDAALRDPEGRAAAVLSIEGIYGPETEGEVMPWVDTLWNGGVRSVHVVHNDDNMLATGHPTHEDHGLTRVGKQFVREGAERGFYFDLSHASEHTADDIIDVLDTVDGANPAFISHTGSRALNGGGTRNTPDRVAVRVAERGGVIGVMPARWIVEPSATEDAASVVSVGRTYDHLLDVLSDGGVAHPERHLAIGTDFGGMGTESIIKGMEDITKVGPALSGELLRRGHEQGVVDRILFGNAVDLFRGLPQR